MFHRSFVVLVRLSFNPTFAVIATYPIEENIIDVLAHDDKMRKITEVAT